MSDYPLHRLNTPQTKMWFLGGTLRARLVERLLPLYRGGVGVLAANLRLFALLRPNGSVHEFLPPFKAFEMWQISNKPKPPECPCQNFYYPEAEGPWKTMGKPDHHPLCVFEKTSMKTFTRYEAHVELGEGHMKVVTKEKLDRPDALERSRLSSR